MGTTKMPYISKSYTSDGITCFNLKYKDVKTQKILFICNKQLINENVSKELEGKVIVSMRFISFNEFFENDYERFKEIFGDHFENKIWTEEYYQGIDPGFWGICTKFQKRVDVHHETRLKGTNEAVSPSQEKSIREFMMDNMVILELEVRENKQL